MMNKRAPEIIIVGTMKGGTTILYDYICTHPRVAPGAQKEIHYFSMYPMKGARWYRDQFPERAEQIFSIDASPTYFDTTSMPTLPSCIKKEAPEARIILIARDPIARALSHFQHLRTIAQPQAFAHVDIEEFFSRPLERLYTLAQPTDRDLRYILDFSVYDEKFGNYVSVFGRENVLVLTNGDLRSDPIGTMRRVFAHCRLEWAPSDMFGQLKYLSGSERLPISRELRGRLEGLLYPSYDRFLRRAGLPQRSAGAD